MSELEKFKKEAREKLEGYKDCEMCSENNWCKPTEWGHGCNYIPNNLMQVLLDIFKSEDEE